MERQRRDSYQASATAALNRAMLMSQLAQARSQMPAWGGPAHHLAHREYILDALRKNGTPAPESVTESRFGTIFRPSAQRAATVVPDEEELIPDETVAP